MRYTKLFNPVDPSVSDPAPDEDAASAGDPGAEGAGSDGQVYAFDEDTVLAVNVALVTGRPLLVSGPPGSGKSTLAPNIARIMGYRYYSVVVTARTEDTDLLWREEMLRQLSDAQRGLLSAGAAPVRVVGADDPYCRPGPLWMALDPGKDPHSGAGGADRPASRAVLLIDEIDKADPDFPNALLVPLGELRFAGPGGTEVTVAEGMERPLVVVTTNEERALSAPFLRRCISLRLKPPSRAHLLKVAGLHLGAELDRQLAGQLADHLLESFSEHRDGLASTAEYLDTLRACRSLGVSSESPLWKRVAELAMVKSANKTQAAP